MYSLEEGSVPAPWKTPTETEQEITTLMTFGVKSQQLSHLPGADMARRWLKDGEKGGHASRPTAQVSEKREGEMKAREEEAIPPLKITINTSFSHITVTSKAV